MHSTSNRFSYSAKWLAFITVGALTATGLIAGFSPFKGFDNSLQTAAENESVASEIAQIPQVEANPAVLVKNLDTVAVPADYAAEGSVNEEVYGPATQPASADDNFQEVADKTSVLAAEVKPGDIVQRAEEETTEVESQLPQGLKAVQAATVPVESSVAVAGISWEDSSLLDLVITYRVKQNGVWGAWEETEAEPVFEDVTKGKIGTEPLILLDAQGLEVAVETVEGTPVKNLQLSVVEPFLSEGEARPVADTPNTAESSAYSGARAEKKPYVPAEKPQIITREQWRANPSYLDWDEKYSPLKAVVVHHTASKNNYTAEQAPGIVAGIYYYHAKTLKWGDIGYHFLVDRFGKIYQGRAGDMNRVNEGGHSYGFNMGTVGIAMIGNFMEEQPTDAALDSVAKLAAWKLKTGKLDPHTFITEKKSHLKPGYSEVSGYVLDGHRAWNYTACPGNAFWPRMGEVRDQVKDLIAGKLNLRVKGESAESTNPVVPPTTPVEPKPEKPVKPSKPGEPKPPVKPVDPKPEKPATPEKPSTPPTPAQPPAPVKPSVPATPSATVVPSYRVETQVPELGDMFAITANGDLVNYGGVSVEFGTPIKKGHGWLGATWFDTVDWNQDGYLDVIAIFDTGALKVYFTNSQGIFSWVAQIGHGFNSYKGYIKRDIGVAPRLMTIAPNGDFLIWRNNGGNYVSHPKRIGHGWNWITFPLPIDYDGGGKTDILALDADGKLWTYYMSAEGFVGNRRQVGHGWNVFNRLTTLHGGSGYQKLLGVTATGTLVPYRVTRSQIDRLPNLLEDFAPHCLNGENL